MLKFQNKLTSSFCAYKKTLNRTPDRILARLKSPSHYGRGIKMHKFTNPTILKCANVGFQLCLLRSCASIIVCAGWPPQFPGLRGQNILFEVIVFSKSSYQIHRTLGHLPSSGRPSMITHERQYVALLAYPAGRDLRQVPRQYH